MNRREIRDDLVGEAVREVIVGWVRAQVLERQHGDRRLVVVRGVARAIVWVVVVVSSATVVDPVPADGVAGFSLPPFKFAV